MNPERGTLKDVLNNETVELETEMVVAMMKDMASALKYLHHLDPPILDKGLTSSVVTLNADYGAQLTHLHTNIVRPCLFLFLHAQEEKNSSEGLLCNTVKQPAFFLFCLDASLGQPLPAILAVKGKRKGRCSECTPQPAVDNSHL